MIYKQHNNEKKVMDKVCDSLHLSKENLNNNPSVNYSQTNHHQFQHHHKLQHNQQQQYHNISLNLDKDEDINDEDNERGKSLDKSKIDNDNASYQDPNAKNKKAKSNMKIIVNVSDTQYDVVKYVAKKMFKWQLSFDPDGEWDLFWTDNAVKSETLAKMQPHQKINHFPGMYSLARKNHLGRNLMRMRKAFKENYNFFPPTWLLPTDFNDFKQQFKPNKKKTFIIKPEASSQGRGIFLTKTWENIQPTDHYVAQRYLHKPYLIEGLKFDMRLYVLLSGCDPLKIFLYKEGLARLATEKYKQPNERNIDDVCMHLTNYAINKDNPNFVFNEDANADDVGHKRSLTSIMKMLEANGHDVNKLWSDIQKMIIKTFCSVQPILSSNYKSCQSDDPYNNMCFEILGFDIMLDHKLKPWLIEVNHTPSFTTDTPLDRNIKKSVIYDSLMLMNISIQNKIKYKNKKKMELEQRVLTGKKVNKTAQEKQIEFEQAQKERNIWENQNIGNFIKIFPIDNPEQATEPYDEFLKESNRWWKEWTGTTVKKVTKRGFDEKLPRFTFSMEKSVLDANNAELLRTKQSPNVSYQKAKGTPDLVNVVGNKSSIGNIINEADEKVAFDIYEEHMTSQITEAQIDNLSVKDDQSSKVVPLKKQYYIKMANISASDSKSSPSRKNTSITPENDIIYEDDIKEESKHRNITNRSKYDLTHDFHRHHRQIVDDSAKAKETDNVLLDIASLVNNQNQSKGQHQHQQQTLTVQVNILERYTRATSISPNTTSINESRMITDTNSKTNNNTSIIEINENLEIKNQNDQSNPSSNINASPTGNGTIGTGIGTAAGTVNTNVTAFQPLKILTTTNNTNNNNNNNVKMSYLPRLNNLDHLMNTNLHNFVQSVSPEKNLLNRSPNCNTGLSTPLQMPKLSLLPKGGIIHQTGGTNLANLFANANQDILNNSYDNQLPCVFRKSMSSRGKKHEKERRDKSHIQPRILEFYLKERFLMQKKLHRNRRIRDLSNNQNSDMIQIYESNPLRVINKAIFTKRR